LNLVDGLELLIVVKFPHDPFIAGDFEELRLFADETVPEIITDDCVPLGRRWQPAERRSGLPGKSFSFNSQTTFSEASGSITL
jgi:hypothetical protein